MVLLFVYKIYKETMAKNYKKITSNIRTERMRIKYGDDYYKRKLKKKSHGADYKIPLCKCHGIRSYDCPVLQQKRIAGLKKWKEEKNPNGKWLSRYRRRRVATKTIVKQMETMLPLKILCKSGGKTGAELLVWWRDRLMIWFMVRILSEKKLRRIQLVVDRMIDTTAIIGAELGEIDNELIITAWEMSKPEFYKALNWEVPKRYEGISFGEDVIL